MNWYDIFCNGSMYVCSITHGNSVILDQYNTLIVTTVIFSSLVITCILVICIMCSYNHKSGYLPCYPTMPFTFKTTLIAYLLGNLFPPPQLKEPCHLNVVHPLVLREELYNGSCEFCKVRRGCGVPDRACSGHATEVAVTINQ